MLETLIIGVSFGLPLYLYLKEKQFLSADFWLDSVAE
ncbi:DUF2834 domain-containing protein [Agarivorans sp. Z349TD_8]